MRNRTRRLAAIHCRRRDLGLDDAAYRDLLDGAAGVRSAADLTTDEQYDAVMRAFRAAGHRGRERRLTGREAKCYALWCRLYDAGAVRRRSYRAMTAWMAGTLGAEQDVWRPDQWTACVERLKRWLARVGGRAA